MKQQSVHFVWNEPQITERFSAGVSLHSHTDCSREGLAGVPKYASENALIGLAVARISSRYEKLVGRTLDLERSYFVPPLAPAAAFRLESLQIEMMDLTPVVSITDHDSIGGPQQLHSLVDPEAVPISLEWTMPFGPGFFHIGVHNLPMERANEIVEGLCNVQCSYCRASGISCVGSHDARCLPNVREWLEHLANMPETLIVLNHPLWDVAGLGETAHRNLLEMFLLRYRNWIHALELNGLRSWAENRDVMSLAERWKRPIVSGGDRHGYEPNAVVNLTTARSFSQFAQEIRTDGNSVVLFMRQYQQPLTFRKLRVAWDVLKSSTGLNGERVRWNDRIFMPWIDGRVLPLSSQEWSSTLSNKPKERPQPSECLPCDAIQGTEY
jgi:hypothetical protein